MQMRDTIKQLRTQANMTRAELSEKSGLSSHSIRAYEKGQRTPRTSNLLKILAAVGVAADSRLDLCAMFIVDDKAGKSNLGTLK
jgi:transcriptional regulator with XRE-family HTH domain